MQSSEQAARPFLTAQWRYLAMLNYEIDPILLKEHVPSGTEIDQWQGRTYVSLVGFLFLDTKVLGIPIPYHRNFEEINLRFYVRRKVNGEWLRGVVFLKEIVPRLAIAAVARIVYNENYRAMRMHHEISYDPDQHDRPVRVRYGCGYGKHDFGIALTTKLMDAEIPVTGSEAEFITEHYWGYTRQRDGSTLEYQVTHPRWRVWQAGEAAFDGDGAALYGEAFGTLLASNPVSAFLADGSAVAVSKGRALS